MIFFQTIVPIYTCLMIWDMHRIIMKNKPNWNSKWVLALLFIIFIPGMVVYGIYYPICLHFFAVLLIVQLVFHFLKKPMPLWSLIIPALCSGAIVFAGYQHIYNRQPEYVTLKTDEVSKPVKLIFFADLHYPNANNERILTDITKDFKEEKPNALIMGGDIIDEMSSKKDIEDCFRIIGNLTDSFPVYYVFGNHDTKNISAESLRKILEKNNIQILEDSYEKLDGITLIGRKDKTDKSRLNSKEILKNADEDEFVVLFDHQPLDITENAQSQKVDVMLSGHTHGGQMFPLNLFMQLLPKNKQIDGIKKFENMTSIVSSGITGWGYPVRTQSESEYIVLEIEPEVN